MPSFSEYKKNSVCLISPIHYLIDEDNHIFFTICSGHRCHGLLSVSQSVSIYISSGISIGNWILLNLIFRFRVRKYLKRFGLIVSTHYSSSFFLLFVKYCKFLLGYCILKLLAFLCFVLNKFYILSLYIFLKLLSNNWYLS